MTHRLISVLVSNELRSCSRLPQQEDQRCLSLEVNASVLFLQKTSSLLHVLLRWINTALHRSIIRHLWNRSQIILICFGRMQFDATLRSIGLVRERLDETCQFQKTLKLKSASRHVCVLILVGLRCSRPIGRQCKRPRLRAFER